MPYLTKTISTSENASYAVYPALFFLRVVFWPNLHIYCLKEDDTEDPDEEDEARTQFKWSAMTEMLDGCAKIGVPITPLKTKQIGKTNEMPFASWPIVKAMRYGTRLCKMDAHG